MIDNLESAEMSDEIVTASLPVDAYQQVIDQTCKMANY